MDNSENILKAIKKPIVLKFRRATAEEVIQTLEGPVTALPGDAVLTGTKGENWPIKAPLFAESYNFDEGTGSCSKKPIAVEVECMTEPFEVIVGWSTEPLKGKAGDYRVTYGPNDYGCVAAAIFAETYERV